MEVLGIWVFSHIVLAIRTTWCVRGTRTRVFRGLFYLDQRLALDGGYGLLSYYAAGTRCTVNPKISKDARKATKSGFYSSHLYLLTQLINTEFYIFYHTNGDSPEIYWSPEWALSRRHTFMTKFHISSRPCQQRICEVMHSFYYVPEVSLAIPCISSPVKKLLLQLGICFSYHARTSGCQNS